MIHGLIVFLCREDHLRNTVHHLVFSLVRITEFIHQGLVVFLDAWRLINRKLLSK